MTEYIGIHTPLEEPPPYKEAIHIDSDLEDDIYEDDMVLVGWKTYYKDSEGKLYDPDTHEEVGTFVDGKLVKV